MQARTRFLTLGLALTLAAGVLAPIAALAAGNAVTRHFSAHSETETSPLDHSIWGNILDSYLSEGPEGVNRFDYQAVSATDRAALEGYIEGLTALVPTQLSRTKQLAYWANLYNALTVKVILDHYPVRSIRRIKYGRLIAIGPWGHDLITVEGFDLSLGDIENHILRPIFEAPRIHYAINCASMGCPNLPTEPFGGENLESQLDEAAHAFVNHPRAVHVEDGRIRLSSIYNWYKRDFGGSDGEVLGHIRRYADADLLREMEGISRISGYGYDWGLNEPDEPVDGH